jgi:hypothetical protein
LNLLIIGIGPWSNKIQAAIERSNSAIELQIASARAFISGESHVLKNLLDFDVIWISSRTENQLMILSQLKYFLGVIYIEKPYAANSAGLSDLIEFIDGHDLNIQLSQPWTFSQHWLTFREEFRRIEGVHFEIIRGGATAHKYLNPVLDWIPHDLNLIYSYVGGAISKIETQDIEWNRAGDAVKFKLIVNENYHFRMHSGNLGAERLATWTTGKKIFDFSKPLDQQNLIGENPEPERHSLVDMLTTAKITPKNQLISQLKFHQLVIGSLGL